MAAPAVELQGSALEQGSGLRDTLALSTARDQLRSHVAVPLKVTTSLKLSSLRVRGRVLPTGLSTASGSPRSLVTNSVTARPSVTASTEPGVSVVDLLSATSSTSSRGSLTSSDSTRGSAGTSRVPQVRLDVQADDFCSQNTTVGNLVMPVEALIIASDSICSSTRSKYNSMFRLFVSYGQQMGTNVLLYSFSQVLVIGFFLSIYTNKGSIGYRF